MTNSIMWKLFHRLKRNVVLCAALGLLLCISCSESYKRVGSLKIYDAKEYVVASKQGCYWYDGEYHPYFLVRDTGSTEWMECERIQGFNYESGHEYHIFAEKVIDEDYMKYADSSSAPYLLLLKVLSKEKKETENLPDNIQYYGDNPNPPGM